MMHIFSMKNETKKMRIAPLADAPVLSVPLTRYFGSHPQPVVTVGEKVRKYQLIGEDISDLGLKTHSPVSGEVSDIQEYMLADHTTAVIVQIRNDFQENEVSLPVGSHETASPETLLSLIEAAGVVGEGGAQFPAAVKYRAGGKKISTFIINGAECEPYLTADYAIMSERTEKLLQGMRIINRILQAEEIIIAIEKQNRELETLFAPFLQQEAYRACRMAILSNQYPQGSELQLIKTVTGRELPRSLRPSEAGIIVSNVGTVDAVYDAVVHHRPVISRIVTVSGEAAGPQGNFEVRIGTPVSHLLNTLDITLEGKTLILGGPMMGRPVLDIAMPVTKGTGGLLILPEKAVRRENCISCGYCAEVCPMQLMPMKYEELHRKGRYAAMPKYSLDSCIECAACEYICPSNVPLMESIRMGKIRVKEMAHAR